MGSISIVEVDEKGFRKFQKDILEIERRSFLSPWGIVQFLDELKNSVSHIWVLLEENKVVGYICFWMILDEIHVMNIAIHPDMRRKGKAKFLFKKLIEFAAARNISQIWLEVRPSNKAAINLYSSLGFKKVGIRKRYYPDTYEDAIVMALNIK